MAGSGSGHSVEWDDGTSSLLLVEIGVGSGGRAVAFFDRLGGSVAVGTAAALALHPPCPGRRGRAGCSAAAASGRTIFIGRTACPAASGGSKRSVTPSLRPACRVVPNALTPALGGATGGGHSSRRNPAQTGGHARNAILAGRGTGHLVGHGSTTPQRAARLDGPFSSAGGATNGAMGGGACQGRGPDQRSGRPDGSARAQLRSARHKPGGDARAENAQAEQRSEASTSVIAC